MDHAGDDHDGEQRLDEILAEYLLALESGPPPDRDALLAHYPQFAAQLNEFFADRDQFESAVRPLVAASPAGERTVACSDLRPGPAAAECRVRYFGDFELLAELGRGGMGVVYRARQVSLNRMVALKSVLAGQFAGADDVKRFQVEAENVAQLDHPNIVPIFEVGRHEGQHYYSMKLVEGGSLAGRVARYVKDPRAAAALMAKTARAVHYAHDRGILHRDLKPSNILLDPQGEPQVTDFGLARRLGQASDLTLTGAVVGSPRYMAPEQARGGNAVSVTADVYSLGAVLYELLTGTPPFTADTPLETLRLVKEQEPQRPSLLLPGVDRDLETVCLKCLEKEPSNRYPSARALAEDLERCLAGESISARPSAWWQRTAKWARRRPAMAALAAVSAITVLLIVAISVGLPYGIRLARALKDARQARHEEQVQRGLAEQARQAETAQRKLTEAALVRSENYFYLSQIAFAEREVVAGNVRRAEELLDACAVQKRGWEWHHLKELCHLELESVEIAKSRITVLALSADWARMAVVAESGSLHVLDPATFQTLFELRDQGITCAAFSHDGLLLAIARGDGQLQVLDALTGKELRSRQFKGRMNALALSPGAQTLATAGQDGHITLVGLDSFEEPIQLLEAHSSQVNCLAFSSDGRSLVSGSGKPETVTPKGEIVQEQPGEVKLWRLQDDPRETRLVLTLGAGETAVLAVALSPNGKYVAAGGADGRIQVWNTNGGTSVAGVVGHSGAITALLFDPQRDRLYSAGDTSVRGSDLATLKAAFVCNDHRPISALAYDPATCRLFSGNAEGRVKVWESEPKPSNLRTLSPGRATDVAFSPDGRFVGVGGGNLSMWRLADNHRLFQRGTVHRGYGRVAFSADSKMVAVSEGNGVALYATDTDALVQRIIAADTWSLAFSPDGERIATASKEWVMWDVASGEERFRVLPTTRQSAPFWDVAFSEDGEFVATGGGSIEPRAQGEPWGGIPGSVELWSARTGARVRSFTGSRYCIWNVALSPDGSRIAAAGGMYGGQQGEAKVWDTVTGEELFTFPYPHCAFGVAFSPDNSRLAVVGGNPGSSRTFRTPLLLWDLRTGKQVFALPLQTSAYAVAFDRSGTRLAVAAGDGVHVWEPAVRAPPADPPAPALPDKARLIP